MREIFIPAPHFPPSALPPAQRVRLLTRHLHAFGWQPVIFTVAHRYREELADPWMVEIAGENYEKIEVGSLDQRKTRKIGIGDLGIRMFWPLCFSLIRNARKRGPAAILYPVPPWYIMVMAPVVKWLTGIPYAIDFIDPWVYNVEGKGSKARISQWIARRMEGFAVKRSDAIFAVSQGILDDLVKRYPSIAGKPLVAVPYGVEASDFLALKLDKRSDNKIVIRYTGAISQAMLPVVDTLFKALKLVRLEAPVEVIFTGTSYAGAGLVQPVLNDLIAVNDVSSFVIEYPARVGYKTALELSMSSDMQLLIGDTTPYYAASKMMGLAASGRPFFAFVHKNSFPSTFLDQLGYLLKTGFEPEDLATQEKIEELAAALLHAIKSKDNFRKIDIANPALAKYTAESMTRIFSDTLKKIAHE